MEGNRQNLLKLIDLWLSSSWTELLLLHFTSYSTVFDQLISWTSSSVGGSSRNPAMLCSSTLGLSCWLKTDNPVSLCSYAHSLQLGLLAMHRNIRVPHGIKNHYWYDYQLWSFFFPLLYFGDIKYYRRGSWNDIFSWKKFLLSVWFYIVILHFSDRLTTVVETNKHFFSSLSLSD